MSSPGNMLGNLIVQQMLANCITEQMVPYRGQKGHHPGPGLHFLFHLSDSDRAQVTKLFS
jgi:hypothetical protein